MNIPKEILISIADDHVLVRKGFISLLHTQPHIKVINEADNGKMLLEGMKKRQPHIALLDIEMPVMNGRETLEIINKKYPEVRVIMLSMHNQGNYISEFMTNGACAFLPKNADPKVLIHAIESVYLTGKYYNAETSEALLKGLKRNKGISLSLQQVSLSERELEILKKLCEGKTNNEIGAALNISYNTVHFHRGNIYQKTKTKNISDLIKYAVKHGIIELS